MIKREKKLLVMLASNNENNISSALLYNVKWQKLIQGEDDIIISHKPCGNCYKKHILCKCTCFTHNFCFICREHEKPVREFYIQIK